MLFWYLCWGNVMSYFCASRCLLSPSKEIILSESQRNEKAIVYRDILHVLTSSPMYEWDWLIVKCLSVIVVVFFPPAWVAAWRMEFERKVFFFWLDDLYSRPPTHQKKIDVLINRALLKLLRVLLLPAFSVREVVESSSLESEWKYLINKVRSSECLET